MRVVGATFADRSFAERAFAELLDAGRMGPGDASLAPLGTASRNGEQTLLAGRFRDELVSDARRILERLGGRIVADVDEAATRKRRSLSSDSGRLQNGHNPAVSGAAAGAFHR
jgi:hypothetical protein